MAQRSKFTRAPSVAIFGRRKRACEANSSPLSPVKTKNGTRKANSKIIAIKSLRDCFGITLRGSFFTPELDALEQALNELEHIVLN